MKIIKRLLVILLVLGGVYLAGPRFPKPEFGDKLPEIAAGTDHIEEYVKKQEAGLPIKPDNNSIILWGDSTGQPTEYVLLYLHGFSASRYEGFPITHDFVKNFRVNAYLPRLAEHGLIDKDPLLNMTPERLYASAREALAIAHKLGNKVIIMGTSTGCTLALMLAADFPGQTDGLILYSPNIEIKQKSAALLSGPWGLQIGRLAFGGIYRLTDDDPDSKTCAFWNCKYRIEATVYLQQILDAKMNKEVFSQIKIPVFMAYYYKDAQNQDQTIEVKAAIRMFNELGTPASEKESVVLPGAGTHVIGCELTSKAVDELRSKTFSFVEEHLIPASK